MAKWHGGLVCWFSFLAFGTTATCASAKDGILALRVTPRQAYVFIDGTAMHAGGGRFRCSPGQHTVVLYNYGYKNVTENFTIAPGKVTRRRIVLELDPGESSGPWGRIQLRGQRHSVVLLNGKKLSHFVGHVDEFDHNTLWKQELLVPPGLHQITILHPHDNKEVYSGTVEVKPNERVIVDLNRNGQQVRKPWSRGQTLKSMPRFRAGLSSTTVAVSAVAGGFSATPTQINCGESTQLAWSTTGTVEAEISGLGSVPTSGQRSVQPKGTTTYKFTASGPGGISESSATVTVNKVIAVASLSFSPEEVHYRRVGDQVVDQGSATLSWSVSNAESVSINGTGSVSAVGLGAVNANGSRIVQPIPQGIDPGPVDETLTYTLTATNSCGGSETRTATLHLTGSIEEVQKPSVSELEMALAMNSIYFPTALPSQRYPNDGLIPSQQRALTGLAINFKKYIEFRPDAHLVLQAHADQRGSPAYNKALSRRRASSVKNFLVERGIPAENVETVAFGKERNLEKEAVQRLEEQNPNLTPELRDRVLRELRQNVLANNRRVDIVLSTTGRQSSMFFPHNAEDAEQILGGKATAERPGKPKTKK